MGGTLLHPVLGQPVRKVLQAGTEKQEKAARPWAAHPATASSNWDCFGIAPCARGEHYRLRFQGWSDSLPRTLPHSISYLRVQSPLYSFPALSQSRRCQMWHTPGSPTFWEPLLPRPLSYSRESANSSGVLVPELVPWTCFIQLPPGSRCSLGWAAATHTEALQVHSRWALLSLGFAQVCMPLNSKTGLTTGRGRLPLPGQWGTWPRG